MKYLLIIIVAIAGFAFTGSHNYKPTTLKRDTVPTGAAPQLFGSKLYEFRNYTLTDSFIMIMGGDTFAIPRWPAIKYKTSDNRWYGYHGTRWRAFLNGTDTVSLSNRINSAGITLNNVGTGYNLVATPAGDVKRINNNYGILIDSATSNTNTVRADTSSTNHLVTLSDLNDAIAASAQTFPQTLAVGRTFAANDSVILNNNIIKFKGGTIQADSLAVNHVIKLPYTRSADTGVVFVNGIRFMHNYQDRAGQADGQNTFLGIEAGNFTMGPAGGAVQLGGRNIGIGYKSLQSNTTGWQNTGVGHISLQKNTTGIYNTAVGAYALVENTTADNNTGIGADALWLNTTGNDNTGVGTYVLQQNTTGFDNTAVGSNTMMQNLTGANNVAVGKAALKFNQVYSYNTAVGFESMRDANIGSGTAVGARSLQSNLAGGNTAVGTFSAQNNTTGANNTVMGYASKANATTGNDNTGVGALSLAALTTGDGNTVIGQKAAENTTTGNDNIFIGNNAGNNNVTGSRHIVISTDGEVPTGAEDGSLNIQNIIFGVSNTATGQTLSGGRIGIGAIIPAWGLDVQRSIGANKDSMPQVGSLTTETVMLVDTTTGRFKRVNPSVLSGSATTIYTGNGTLSADRTVTTGGFTTIWTGSNDNETSFSVTNTGTTNASAIAGTANGTTSIGVSGTSSAYIGVFGTSTTNNGLQGQSSSGIGVVGVSSTGAALRGQINPSSNNAIENIVTLARTSSSGAGANGLGAAIQYELETATNGNSQTAGSTAFKWTDATNATRTSQYEIYGVNSAATARKAALAGSGQWTWDGYGAGTFTGTPTVTLQATSAGAIIEGPVVAAGTYTPTLTNTTNVAASTPYSCQYMRVGNTVTVSGKVDIDPTATGATLLGISLPIASAFANDNENGGTASCGTSEGLQGSINADVTNDRATLDIVIPAAGSVANNSWFFTFTYRII